MSRKTNFSFAQIPEEITSKKEDRKSVHKTGVQY